MSEGSKEKAANSGQARPAQPQATWPMPAAMPDFGQWPQMFWSQQWPAMAAYHPAYQQMYMQQAATSATAPPPAAAASASSPRSKDDSVKVVKPKDPFVRGIHSPAGIQSPKPNSPGFLLGAGKGVGGRAFSVYTSRSEVPGGAAPVTSQASVETGVDLTQKSMNRKSKSAAAPTSSTAAEKDKKDDRPVGVAVARQRSATDSKSQTDSAEAVVVSSSTTTVTSTAVTTSTTTSQAGATTSVNNQWPSFAPSMPYMANPYQHYAIAAQPAMYMMPTHRPIFPGQPGVAPGYIPVPPQQMMMPELTVKTSQTQAKAHASTSPNKPVSASASPKSPLDKAREKLNEINQRKGSCSGQPSPSSSEAKSVSSESTEKTAEGAETKPYHKSVIMTNTQALRSPEVTARPPALHSPPTKKERKEKQAKIKQNAINKTMGKSSTGTARRHSSAHNTKLASPDKNPRLKARKSAAMSPSAADAAISLLETLPDEPKPLIAPAKFKPEPRLSVDEDTTSSSSFTEPLAALKRSLSLDKPKSRRSRERAAVSDNTWSSPNMAASSISDTSVTSTVPSSLSSDSLVEAPRGRAKLRRTASAVAASDAEPLEQVRPAKTARGKQTRARAQKRNSTESASITQASGSSAATPPIPVDVENKEYIWAENAFDPIIVKHNHEAYDICEDDDLKQLETKLKQRLKAVNKQIQAHEKHLKNDSSAAFPLLMRSISSASESQDCPLSPDKLKSSFSVRSDSHPSLKMKAAAKAKSRASQDEKAPETPTSPLKSPLKSPTARATKDKPMTPLTPISIPEQQLDCRRLTQKELLSTDGLILTCIEGLFYESRIKPISPPDLYGVAIDGERHSSKPRIFTEEELLDHTYTNRSPTCLSQLSVGSRVCAYWSEMISHLYPGKVTDFYPAKNSHAKHLIDIEFDDGDSGKFPLHQIRILPHDLPHIEYDTSNEIPMGRKRRYAVPETPPIMTTPPNRSRMSCNSITVETESPAPPAKKKRAEKAPKKGKGAKEPELFDQSTDDENVEVENKSGWKWVGPCTKKPTRGRGVRLEYQSATKDGETISLGNFVEICPPKLSETPYIAEIQSLWSKSNGEMNVTVKWFYHPEELEVKNVSLPKHKGALFRTEHSDTILVESVKQKCEVHSHEVYVKKKFHLRTVAEKKKNDQFYIAGIYDPGNKILTTRYY